MCSWINIVPYQQGHIQQLDIFCWQLVLRLCRPRVVTDRSPLVPEISVAASSVILYSLSTSLVLLCSLKTQDYVLLLSTAHFTDTPTFLLIIYHTLIHVHTQCHSSVSPQGRPKPGLRLNGVFQSQGVVCEWWYRQIDDDASSVQLIALKLCVAQIT